MNISELNKTALLSTAYFGNLHYYSKFLIFKNIIIEQFENFSKQSFRNRFEILSANGKISLSVPIIKNSNQKTLIKDIKIDYCTNWQKLHFKSIESAYSSSPFYEFYIDDFLFVFEKQTSFLLDLNQKILCKSFEILNIPIEKVTFSEDFIIKHSFDYRNSINPKVSNILDQEFKSIEYYQVFFEKFKFYQNLSILDLIFNMGPDSNKVLTKSIEH